MSLFRVLEHREKPKRVVSSGSRSRQSHFACRLVEIQISSKPRVMQLYRNPDPGQATWYAVAAGSKSRPSHLVCGCIGIQISAKALGVRLHRDPDLGQAALCAVGSRYRSGQRLPIRRHRTFRPNGGSPGAHVARNSIHSNVIDFVVVAARNRAFEPRCVSAPSRQKKRDGTGMPSRLAACRGCGFRAIRTAR